METVGFTRMDQGRAEDWRLVAASEEAHRAGFADRLLELFQRCDGFSFAHKVTSYRHGLQTATRALRDGADDETVFIALLHDVGEAVSPENHAEASTALLRPYISDDAAWLVRHHGLFQGYYYFQFQGRDRNERDRYADHPAYRRTVEFCARWDQVSFDPDYDTLPIGAFEALVRRTVAKPPRPCL